ncbi:uncharacterized protein LOC108907782 isoform X2 [Anoplophora glabripennis]|uniref:uncharacterized protein LOC108907782 isoform X2 n=1 Tax=Anoplophora glabripennis TaxID=217634 RepID=UPI000873CD69|nr:uncharacterized protein LOC108907782 isoform X2 [Anoplophora glabripennis]
MYKIFVVFCVLLIFTKGQYENSESEEKGTTQAPSLDSQEEIEHKLEPSGKPFLARDSKDIDSDERRYKDADYLQTIISMGRRL